jgi:hypothetical protein
VLALTGMTITEKGEPGKGARFEIVVAKGELQDRFTKSLTAFLSMVIL